MRNYLLILPLFLVNVFAVAACVHRPHSQAVAVGGKTTQAETTYTSQSPSSSTTTPPSVPSQSVFTPWQAGRVVSEAQIKAYGLHQCFVQEPITDLIFARMQGKSYKQGCTLPLTDLRYVKVLHYNAQGKPQLGELVCHKNIAADLVDIFKNLYKAHYRIARMVLIDAYGADDERSMAANNTACFNYRKIAGSQRLSNHSTGCAIDINPLYNPYVWRSSNGKLHVSPTEARPYANRSKTFPYKIDTTDLCYREFIRHGFVWGGAWKRRKDYQHFEKKIK